MNRLLILSARATAYHELVRQADLPDLTVVAMNSPDEARALAGSFNLVLGDPGLIATLLPALGQLEWVQSTWAGVEALVGPGRPRDYVLTNVRDVLSPLIVEYVLCYLLMHERRALARYHAQLKGLWDTSTPGTLRGRELGLLGVGSIGAQVARMAKSFGMITRGFTRASRNCEAVDRYYHDRQLMEFATGLDYLVCALPGTRHSRNLVNAQLLAALPAQCVLINVGRGTVVDEDALALALQSGTIAGAVLDVFQEEPLPSGHKFWNTPNLLISAHTAAPSLPEFIAPVFLQNYQRFIRGEPLQYQVDFDQEY
jgi:phosphoglycerate dehydrogenase-like enzyme